ncbi:MAG: GNAT family N-acetyltransferase [Chryseolinea sp.]
MDQSVKIIPYDDEHHTAFRTLNLEWLDKFGLKEAPDLEILDDPRTSVLNNGGYIWVATAAEEIVGTSALIKTHHGVYELAKMCVAPSWRGKGISKLLIEVCISKAREIRISKLELFSNHQLQPALKLYEQYGFHYVEVKDSPFVTADIKMEMLLR